MSTAVLSRELRRGIRDSAMTNEIAGALFMLASFVEFVADASVADTDALRSTPLGEFVIDLAHTLQHYVPESAHVGEFKGAVLLGRRGEASDLKSEIEKMDDDTFRSFEEWFLDRFDVLASRKEAMKEEVAEAILEEFMLNVPGEVADEVDSLLESRADDISSALDEIESAIEEIRTAVGCGSISGDVTVAVESVLEQRGERVIL